MYWVRMYAVPFEAVLAWEPAVYLGSGRWQTIGVDDEYRTKDIAQIGPRLIPPSEPVVIEGDATPVAPRLGWRERSRKGATR